MKLGITSDHRGYKLKEELIKKLAKDYEIIDYGCKSTESVDYPDYAFKLGEALTNKEIDYGIASLHDICIKPGSQEENTSAIINAMKHDKIKIIGHPDNGYYPVDYEKLALAAKEYNVLLELNNSSVRPDGERLNSRENMKILLKYCAQHQTNLIINSDAHIANVQDILSNSFSFISQNQTIRQFRFYVL